MNSLNMLDAKHHIQLLNYFGITHPFFNVNVTTIIGTWAALIAIVCLTCIVRLSLHYHGIIRHLALETTRSFIDVCTQSLEHPDIKHMAFLFSLFMYLFICNIIGIIPHIEEPTIDVNTTFALSIIAFIYINGYALSTHGIKGYLKEFIEPFFLMMPLHVIGKLSTIVSMAFRLFGNMMGGFVISNMYFAAVGSHWIGIILNYITGFNILITVFFGLFESFIQAFVFTLLTLTYLSLALQNDAQEGAHHV